MSASRAAQSRSSSTAALGLAMSWLQRGSLLLWMSKTCSLTERDLKLNPDSFRINEFNHDFICEFIYKIYDFTIFFMIMKSFPIMNSSLNSYLRDSYRLYLISFFYHLSSFSRQVINLCVYIAWCVSIRLTPSGSHIQLSFRLWAQLESGSYLLWLWHSPQQSESLIA